MERQQFGSPGWTRQSRICAVLDDHWIGREIGGCRRFDRIGPLGVHSIALAMTQANLEDAHNSAPAVSQLVQLALTNPWRVLLGGYWVMPPRKDERISFDTVWIRDISPDVVWTWLQTQIPQLEATNFPDEVSAVVGPQATSWLRMWWD